MILAVVCNANRYVVLAGMLKFSAVNRVYMPVELTVGPTTESITVHVVTLGCPDNDVAL